MMIPLNLWVAQDNAPWSVEQVWECEACGGIFRARFHESHSITCSASVVP